MENKIYDCIVIGGGISGIAFAAHLAPKNNSVLILEKEPKLGGRVRSIRSKENPDFWCELGAHTCYNSYTELINLVKETGNQAKIVSLESLSYKLYSRKQIRGVFSEISLLPIVFRFWRYFFSEKTGKTARAYFEPIVGKSNYEKLFSKLFRAVISQYADEYPAEIFLKKRPVKDETISRRFSYQGGLSQMLEDIVVKSAAEVKTSSFVTKIEKKEDGTFLVETSKDVFYARNIAVATDIGAVPDLFSKMQMPEITSLIKSVQTSESISVNFLIKNDHIQLEKLAGIIPLSDEFFSAVSRDGVYDEQWRSFTFHFPESKISPAERLETICRVLGISDSVPYHTEVYRHILPAVRLENLILKDEIDKKLQGTGIYLLGNYFLGMSLEDCVRHSKEQAHRFRHSHGS